MSVQNYRQRNFLNALFYCPLLYASPQACIELSMGRMDSPRGERAYSTLGGTSAYTVLVMMPSVSMERRLSVRTFWLMPSNDFCSSLKRHGRTRRLRIMSSFHLFPMSCTVVATGHSGNSDFVFIEILLYSKNECYSHIIIYRLRLYKRIFTQNPEKNIKKFLSPRP